MRKCDKLLPWVFSGLLLFATHNSLPLAQEQTAKYDVGAEYNKRQKNLNSPLKKASLTGFHATAKHIAAKAVSPSSETMRTI